MILMLTRPFRAACCCSPPAQTPTRPITWKRPNGTWLGRDGGCLLHGQTNAVNDANPPLENLLALPGSRPGGHGCPVRSTPFGLGLVNDSAYYIEGAANLLAGKGFVRLSGGGELKPITHFPPLFSLVLAGLGLAGMDCKRGAAADHSFVWARYLAGGFGRLPDQPFCSFRFLGRCSWPVPMYSWGYSPLH